ncbi:MAG: hypothetical protein A4S09_02660 [Proteobacteria bacterium SG_bin7]|nr:MAG: hypothetical protein A4S09_02660 [Proteobacteria bacterium SG_bin7]
MQVVHFCPRPSFSGLEQYAWILACAQKTMGHEVKFVALRNSPLEKKCIQTHIPVIPLDFYLRFGTHLFTNEDDIKILHLHSTLDARYLWPFLFFRKYLTPKKLKIILQTHIWLDHKKNDPFHKLLYSNIDEIWCSSQLAKDNLEKIMPVPLEKIRVVNYGRDVKNIDNFLLSREMARHSLKLPQNKTIIGSVNRIDSGKGVFEFVEGMLPLLKSNMDLAIAWVGHPTADQAGALYNRKLMHFIHELPIDIRERVFFVGGIPDSYKYLRAFDGYILPTYKECFSLGLMEAQVAGVPCMGTNSGGTPEIINEGKTGWLFAPKSPTAVTEVVERFLGERNCWEEFAKRARLRMEKDFDFPVVFLKVMNMYQD